MLAYVNLVQRKEKEIGCDVLTHQKWFVSCIFRCQCILNVIFAGVVQTTSTELYPLFRRALQVHLL